MTIAAWASRRTYPGLPTPEIRLLRVSDDTQVRADCYWQPERTTACTLLGLHGLEGSSDSHYMQGIAHKGWRRGANVILLNQRNCGGTEHLTPHLYHSGLTADPIAVMRSVMQTEHLASFVVVGYSLGGNLTLKLASELPELPDLPVRAVAAVSPTIDLALCVDAIEWWQNRAYQWHFVQALKARMRRKDAAHPGVYDLAPLERIRTIRDFDDTYTGPCNGFGTAVNYYAINSASSRLDRIEVPALVIAAADDPFVPVSQFLDPAAHRNPLVEHRVQPHGGHCGFVARASKAHDGYWAEAAAVEFVISHAHRS